MATKKSAARKTRSKRKATGRRAAAGERKTAASPKGGKKQRILKELRELTAKARNEVEKLLKDEEAGTATVTELKCGLEEIEQNLKQIGVFQHML